MSAPHHLKSVTAARRNTAGSSHSRRAGNSTIVVGPIGAMRDFWGRGMARPLPPALIRKALTDHLHQQGNLLLLSLQQLSGQVVVQRDVKRVKATLFQEGEFQYIFQVNVDLAAAPSITLAMPVAKGGGRINRTAADELRHLHELYTREPRFVVRPLAGGLVPLPSMDQANSRGAVFVYYTTWLNGLHELGVDARLNYFINEIPFHAFDRKTSDRIRGRILTILFSLYDPRRHRAMAPPQIASGDFVISRPRHNASYELKLIACRRMLSKVSLDQCLRLYLGYHGIWADKTFHLLPRDPRLLAEALQVGLVERNPGIVTWEQVLDAVRGYVTWLRRSSLERSGTEWSPLSYLRMLIR